MNIHQTSSRAGNPASLARVMTVIFILLASHEIAFENNALADGRHRDFLSDGSSMPLSHTERNIAVVEYTKAELAALRPQFQSQPESPVKLHLKNFLSQLSHDATAQTALIDLHNQRASAREDADLKRLFQPDAPQATSAITEVSERLQSNSSRLLSDRLIGNIDLVKQFQGGLKLDLKLSNMFGRKASPRKHEPKALRYGLVLKGIEPSFDGARQAAVGEFKPEDLAHAGQAEVHWTIEPVMDNSQVPLFNVDPQEYAYENSVWGKIRRSLPSPDFTANIVPKAAVAGANPELPPMLLTVDQVEGLYRMEYHTLGNFKKERITHGVSTPIYDQVRARQTMNEQWDPEKTSVENIFNSRKRMFVNVHYLNVEDRVQGDLTYSQPDFSMVFTADTPQGWDPTNDFGKMPGENYQVTLQTQF